MRIASEQYLAGRAIVAQAFVLGLSRSHRVSSHDEPTMGEPPEPRHGARASPHGRPRLATMRSGAACLRKSAIRKHRGAGGRRRSATSSRHCTCASRNDGRNVSNAETTDATAETSPMETGRPESQGMIACRVAEAVNARYFHGNAIWNRS
jgi:hypothetical protein